MMENLLYALLLLGTGWTIGSAAFGAFVFMKVRKYVDHDYRKRYLWMALAKSFYALTSGVLMFRIVQIGSVDATGIAWAYALLTFGAGYSFTMVAATGVEELAYREAELWANNLDPKYHREESREQRFASLESRVTAEEHRNTDIEEAARLLGRRVGKEEDGE